MGGGDALSAQREAVKILLGVVEGYAPMNKGLVKKRLLIPQVENSRGSSIRRGEKEEEWMDTMRGLIKQQFPCKLIYIRSIDRW